METKVCSVQVTDEDALAYFRHQTALIKQAATVNQMVEIMSTGLLCSDEQKVKYMKSLRRELNQKFHGNLEKCREHFLTDINISEHNFFTE